MRNSYNRRLAALEADQRPAQPAWSVPVNIVAFGDDGQALGVVRRIPARPVVPPFDYAAVVAELWEE